MTNEKGYRSIYGHSRIGHDQVVMGTQNGRYSGSMQEISCGMWSN